MLFRISYDFFISIEFNQNSTSGVPKQKILFLLRYILLTRRLASRKMAEQETRATTDVCSEWGNEVSDTTSDFLTSKKTSRSVSNGQPSGGLEVISEF